MDSALALISLLLGLGLGLFLFVVLPARMAIRRNRKPVVWVLISLVGSPLLAILLLIALGPQPADGPDGR